MNTLTNAINLHRTNATYLSCFSVVAAAAYGLSSIISNFSDVLLTSVVTSFPIGVAAIMYAFIKPSLILLMVLLTSLTLCLVSGYAAVAGRGASALLFEFGRHLPNYFRSLRMVALVVFVAHGLIAFAAWLTGSHSAITPHAYNLTFEHGVGAFLWDFLGLSLDNSILFLMNLSLMFCLFRKPGSSPLNPIRFAYDAYHDSFAGGKSIVFGIFYSITIVVSNLVGSSLFSSVILFVSSMAAVSYIVSVFSLANGMVFNPRNN